MADMKLSITRAIRAARHLRGYGVHSPFAYILATEILRLPRRYSYYAEAEITRNLPPSFRKRGLALLRYAWRFRNTAFLFMDTKNYGECDIFRTCLDKSTTEKPEVSETTDTTDFLRAVYASTHVATACGDIQQLTASIAAGTATGILFYSPDSLIYFPNRKVRFVAYEYRF